MPTDTIDIVDEHVLDTATIRDFSDHPDAVAIEIRPGLTAILDWVSDEFDASLLRNLLEVRTCSSRLFSSSACFLLLPRA